MIDRGRQLAVLEPEVAYIVLRELGPQLRQKARAMTASDPSLAARLAAGVAQLEASARPVAELLAGRKRGSAAQAEGGSVEVAHGPGAAGSSRPPRDALVGLTPREAGELLGVTARRVVQMVDDKVLSGWQAGPRRPWVIDPVSVTLELDRRDQERTA